MSEGGGERGPILAADVGGTFTDVVRWDGSSLRIAKESSTPDDQSLGVVAGARRTGPADRFLHGTTVATNALLERRGARCALITSPGFTDLIEIGRQDRPSLYDPTVERPVPLVERRMRFEAPDDPERWSPPDELGDAEAVAVSLLYGYRRAEAETAIATRVAETWPDRPVVCSSEVVPEFREFERSATTVLNAYLTPSTAGYLDRLISRCADAGLPDEVLVMRSSGGLIPISEAVRLPVAVLLSGPAGGVMAAGSLGEAVGVEQAVSFDMGGTSTDVCRIEGGRPEVAYEREIDGFPCRMPSVAIHTVGAGGGSIGWRDQGGSLRVGPHSAGARPGPAAYGRGGHRPTVTDANVVLGRIAPDARLAGSLPIQPDLATSAVERLGTELGLGVTETALGMCTVVEEVMAAAIRKVSLEEGADPRRATLVAFGGAGGLHATALARRLGMTGVIVPRHAGVFSALGLLMSPPRIDVSLSRRIEAGDADRLPGLIDGVVEEARRRFVEAIGVGATTADTMVDARYVGQAHELTVPYVAGDGWTEVTGRFHDAHRTRNGFSRPQDPVEVVTLRVEAVGEPAVGFGDLPEPRPEGERSLGSRGVVTPDGEVDAAVVRRAGLAPGDEVEGPAVIEEDEATTYLATGERALVHASGALVVEW